MIFFIQDWRKAIEVRIHPDIRHRIHARRNRYMLIRPGIRHRIHTCWKRYVPIRLGLRYYDSYSSQQVRADSPWSTTSYSVPSQQVRADSPWSTPSYSCSSQQVRADSPCSTISYSCSWFNSLTVKHKISCTVPYVGRQYKKLYSLGVTAPPLSSCVPCIMLMALCFFPVRSF